MSQKTEHRPGHVDELSLGELVGRLVSESGELIRQEVRLAKLELHDSVHTALRGAGSLGVALILGLLAGLSLTTFLIIVLGGLLGSYWVSALLIGLVLGAAAVVFSRRAMKALRVSALHTYHAADRVRRDAVFLKEEAEDFRREITS